MTESQYDEVVQALTDMNVKLVDVNGNYRDTYDIFKDIAAQWDKMSSTDQAALATKLSGTRMQAVFYSLVQNFGEAEKAMEAMGAAEGELTEKNEVFANSIEGRMNQFRNEFKKLGTEIFTSDWIKDAVAMARDLLGVIAKITKAITSVVKALGGIKVVLPGIVLAVGAMKLLNTARAISAIAKAGQSLNVVQKLIVLGNGAMVTSNIGLTASFKALAAGIATAAKAFLATPVGLITAGLVSGIALYKVFASLEEKREAARQASIEKAYNNLEQTSDAIATCDSKISEYNSKIAENRKLLTSLSEIDIPTIADQQKIDNIKAENDELERQIEYLELRKQYLLDEKNGSFLDVMQNDWGAEVTPMSYGRYKGTSKIEWYRDVVPEMYDYISVGDMGAEDMEYLGITRTGVEEAKRYIERNLEDIRNLLSTVEWIPNPTTEAERQVNAYIAKLELISDRYRSIIGDDSNGQKAFARLSKLYDISSYDEFLDLLSSGDERATQFVNDLEYLGIKTGEVKGRFYVLNQELQNTESQTKSLSTAVKSLKDALSEISQVKPGLDQLDKIYADILNGGKFDYTSLIDEDFTERFGGLESFDEFIHTIANAPDDINACQAAFNRLTSEYIMQSGCLDDLDEDTRAMMLRFLAEQGVIDDTGEAADRLTQIYRVLDAQKKLLEEHKLETSSDVDALIALATQADATSASIIRLTNAKAMLAKAEAIGIQIDSNPNMNVKEAQRLEQLAQRLTEQATAILSKPIEFDLVKINYSGGDTTQGVRDAATKETEKAAEDAAKEAAKNTKTWFEEQYAEHKHLVAMEKETDYEYYTWLEGAMKKAYAEGILSQEDYWKYEEEVYNGMKKLRENAEKEAQSNFDKLVDIRKKMLEKEVSDQKDALNDELKNLKDFYDKQRKMLQDSYDEEDYLEEQAEKRKSVSDLEEELARLRYDDSAWAQKRKAELSQQITDARKDLNDFERDHARDEALSFLDEQEEAAEAKINSKLDALEEKAKSAKELNDQAIEDVKNGTAELYREMIAWNAEYGDGLTETVTAAWNGLYQAASDYKQLVGTIFNGVKIANVTGYKLKPIGTGYASGTSYATPGLHPIDEKGSETYFSPSTGGKYKMFSGGEKVLTAKASDFLYRFANGGSEMLKKFIASVGGGVLNDRLTPLMTNNEIVMGDIYIEGDATSKTVSEIRRAQRESVEFMLKEFGKLNR